MRDFLHSEIANFHATPERRRQPKSGAWVVTGRKARASQFELPPQRCAQWTTSCRGVRPNSGLTSPRWP